MRRKQTALLITAIILGSMVFASQIRPNSSVDSVNPNDANEGGPPVTDHDKDGMPDLHEEAFSESIDLQLGDRSMTVPGLDWQNGSDNSSDADNDGLTALMEYCWPYDLDSCFSSNRTSLPGKPPELSESGLRWFLDPRMGDTDGDGLPDGYEVSMCMSETGYRNESHQWTCLAFDPLNASDGAEDSDRCPDLTLGCGDGFDVDRDGVVEPHEYYTNAEEYHWGAAENWTTEFDGLRCTGELLYILSAACQDDPALQRPTGDAGWLGTDPLRNDSDYYRWVGNRALGQSQKGDGIEDGWEVYFGLDPRNSSDNVRDGDLDGWDMNRDGLISPDTSPASLDLGEAFSNLEEYLVYLDDGLWVRAGMKSMPLDDPDAMVTTLDQGTMPAMAHHDVHTLFADDAGDMIWAGTRAGVTVMDAGEGTTTSWTLPDGEDLEAMHWWPDGGADDGGILLLATSTRLLTLRTTDAGGFDGVVDAIEHSGIDLLSTLETGSGGLDMVATGPDQAAWTFNVDSQGRLGALSAVDQLTVALQSQENTTVNALLHFAIPGAGTHLMVGTNNGLLLANSTDLVGGFAASWIFNATNAEDYVATADAFIQARSARVNALVLDGPRDNAGALTVPSSVWVLTAGGVNNFDLNLLESPLSAFDRTNMRHPDSREHNDVYALLPTDAGLLVGSKAGSWTLAGDHTGVWGIDPSHGTIPGKVVDLATLEIDGNSTLYAGLDPGRYANRVLIDPNSNDSDADGMPDGWEFAHGLDPTDPFDRDLDPDADGTTSLDRDWTNLDEFRYVATTAAGYNSTDPRLVDTDGDGLADGKEFWGYFLEETNFTCHYVNDEYVCDEAAGQQAEQVYTSGWQDSGASGGTDRSLDPTNRDTDGDGMPDGWEIEYRRWIGTTFTGGNSWSLDPFDPNDAHMDADGDGLDNLCEYEWQQVLEQAQAENLTSHNETTDGAANWVATDPNLVDSDGDGLPDGWEARYGCDWLVQHQGINPLNGSDAFSNPDGDGYDANHDGQITQDEAYTNWMEYHVSALIMMGNMTQDGDTLPFTTSLWNATWTDSANEPFGTFVDSNVLARMANNISQVPLMDHGSSEPLDRYTDDDGMPDGWEVWFARWDTFVENWTLNPVAERDAAGDPDGDGMTNWEEYNAIDALSTESDPEKTSPQYFVIVAQGNAVLQIWSSAGSTLSFGAFITPEQFALTGATCDPNNPDTDGDGMYDGIEVLFTQWNSSDAQWTLNPLVAGDGHYDQDRDALTDLQELNLSTSNPVNGGLSPPDAPKMHEEASMLNPGAASARVYSMLFAKEGRALIALAQYAEWQSTGIAPPLLQTIIGITDPTNNDTDDDGMIDGYEYWFTEWDLDGNYWQMNPLSDADVDHDSDDDSWDCNGDGEIDENESYNNLREYEARIYGRFDQRFTIPSSFGLVSYGKDAITAQMQEQQIGWGEARGTLYDTFVGKDVASRERMNSINTAYADNWNLSLLGISDPTHPDSDQDGMPDGWEFCHSRYREVLPVNTWRWTLNPVNPLDVDYDPDEDGWFDRHSGDVPAVQGTWDSRVFTVGSSASQIAPGNGPLFFTNIMEWDNGTLPIHNDTDGDAIIMKRTENAGVTIAYENDWALLDGREVFKFGTNPGDNDTDGDMLPDHHEYARGWNETNDNYSSYMHIEVQWQDFGSTKKPLNLSNGGHERPEMRWTWAQMDPRDPSDAVLDPDNDGGWDCTGPTCVYIPYNNFQEYFGNTTLTSATNVRSTPLLYQGTQITEWWQLRSWLLHLDMPDELERNYFRMNRVNSTDVLFAHVVDDKDLDYLVMDPTDDVQMCRGDWTDDWGKRFGVNERFPNIGQGEYSWGWYILDDDGDNIADGTNPFNFDTDGDWINDWFEIDDDMLDGIRGNGPSPIRYDDRATA